MGVLFACASGCDDSGPIEVEFDAPAWIHDRIRIEFSEPVRSTESAEFLLWPEARVEDAAGTLLATTRSSIDSTDAGISTLDVHVDADVIHAGTTRVVIGGVTNGDATLTTSSFDWTVNPWVEEAVEIELGEAPSRIVMLGAAAVEAYTVAFQGTVGAIWTSRALSANVAETPASPEISVEGGRGIQHDERDGEVDRGVAEGVQAPGAPRTRAPTRRAR